MEPAEKRANSKVLVLGFSQALKHLMHALPLGRRPILPCSLQYQLADTFAGFGFAGLKTWS